MVAPSSLLTPPLLATAVAAYNASQHQLNPVQLIGANSPWFQGPYNGIPYVVPDGCTVDTAVFVSRHASRYPDLAAYEQWLNLSAKIDAATFAVSDSAPELKFLETWKPAVRTPSQDISAINVGGYKELQVQSFIISWYDMGVTCRSRYPDFYTDNSPFIAWANQYPAAPRVIDSARRGPNSTLSGSVYVLNYTDPAGWANSLGNGDGCPTIHSGSGEESTTWDNTYLPAITAHITNMPYLCGMETPILGYQSPWCYVFTDDELKGYEYAQDIKYYYGGGPGSYKNGTMMLPVLNNIIQRFQDGPNKTYTSSDGSSFQPPPLAAMFTNDGQINQLVSQIGVFDDQAPLPSTYIPAGNKYVASHYVSMRGTIGFERLTCSSKHYMRLTLNDVVYSVPSCKSGPGQSCPLDTYAALIANKTAAAGTYPEICQLNVTEPTQAELTMKATFLQDDALSWGYFVAP
ncbi:putative histidine acid phosphatase [Exophiala viscosa]|uniref:Histidine acid phosphatase n=1 Tax=Exophiala viscosa TaxID=2486360 RepID=A0AAN6DUL1_9EURO|nr:putative histidine acid phosphatase [Exophiala viscosa]